MSLSEPSDKFSVSSDAHEDKRPSVLSGSSDKKWVRFDDSCSTETTLTEPSSYSASAAGSPLPYSENSSERKSIPPPRVTLAGKVTPSDASNHASPAFGAPEIDVTSVTQKSGRTSSSSSKSRDTELRNGKLLAMIKPLNRSCPWFSPAQFDAYRIPSSLTSSKLSLPVEEYVLAMETLINDFRFRSYIVCYRRLLVFWVLFSVILLVAFLLGIRSASNGGGMAMFGATLVWFFVLAIGILVCMYCKSRMLISLEECVKGVNRILVKYDLLLAVDDQGQLSCQKIYIPYIFFKAKDCIPTIVQMLSREDGKTGHTATRRETIDIERGGSQRMLNLEERAERLICRHSQKYVKGLVRKTLKFPTRPLEGVSDIQPLHCTHSYCLCQYLRKNHFEKKPQKWYQKLC